MASTNNGETSIHRQILLPSQTNLTSSPSIVRNPSPPPLDNLSRADMVGDEMYSKSWFCQVLLKLIQVPHLFFFFTFYFSSD